MIVGRIEGPLSGQVLGGKYRLGGLLGKGGVGSVYDAVQLDLGWPVEVKVLHPELAAHDEVLRRLELEAKSAAKLGHPNIVQVTEFKNRAGEHAFLVMERLNGRPMGRVIKHEAPLAEQRVVFVARQVLSALSATHAAGIVHRDLKPDNIFLTSISGMPDIVKLLDFGIAKLQDPGTDEGLTVTGFNPGTPAYMSPEQARGDGVDARSDLYSLGVVMYKALCGKAPFFAPNYNAMLNAIQRGSPTPLAELRPDIDPDLAHVVRRAMALEPGQRFRTAAAMTQILEEAVPDEERSATAIYIARPGQFASPDPVVDDDGDDDAATALFGPTSVFTTRSPERSCPKQKKEAGPPTLPQIPAHSSTRFRTPTGPKAKAGPGRLPRVPETSEPFPNRSPRRPSPGSAPSVSRWKTLPAAWSAPSSSWTVLLWAPPR